MARAVKEWVGKTDDTHAPDRVRVRVFDAHGRKCDLCGRPIRSGERWTLEHVIALINWRWTKEQPHGNRESNFGVTCGNCLPIKNAADVAIKSETYALTRKSVLPHKAKSRPLPCGRNSPYKKKMNGEVVRR